MAGSGYVSSVKAIEIREVRIDVQAMMKIVRHCKDNRHKTVTGQLLGIDADGALKITNCFPFIKQQEPRDEMQDQEDGASYQYDVLSCYETLGYDANAVGWYSSVQQGMYMNQSLIETQYNYQSTLPGGILILCDPYWGVEGDHCLKAVRFKPAFVKMLTEGKFNSKHFGRELSQDAIFDNIPIKVINSHLSRAFIRGAIIPKVPSVPIGLPIGSMFACARPTPPKDAMPCSIDNLGLASDEFLEKQIEYLSHILEQHNSETWRWHCWLKSYSREKQLAISQLTSRNNHQPSSVPPDRLSDQYLQSNFLNVSKSAALEPSKMDSLVLFNQASTCAKQVSRLISFFTTDLYLTHHFATDKSSSPLPPPLAPAVSSQKQPLTHHLP